MDTAVLATLLIATVLIGLAMAARLKRLHIDQFPAITPIRSGPVDEDRDAERLRLELHAIRTRREET